MSEGIDWGVYTWTRRPLADRILLSSVISTPVDSVVFLAMIGHLSAVGVGVMTASKLIAAVVVWYLIRRRAWARNIAR